MKGGVELMLLKEFCDTKVSIVRSKRKTISIEVKLSEVIVRAPVYMKDKEINSFIESKKTWINKHLLSIVERQKNLQDLTPYTKEELNEFIAEAKMIIPKRVRYYAEKIGVDYNRVTIRSQRTRWGSCSSKGNLNFNCLLVLLPDDVLDSIVVHELCHRKHMNHSAKFYTEVEKTFPQYKKCQSWLKENGGLYLSRLP